LDAEEALALLSAFLRGLHEKRSRGVTAGKNITFHHERMRKRLGERDDSAAGDDAKAWAATLSKTPSSDLEKYAASMAVLSERRWVASGYKWAAEHCRWHMGGPGEARAIKRAARQHYFLSTGTVMPRQGPEEEELLRQMGAYLGGKQGDSAGPIRLLDIGSCTNPFSRMEGFEVTALDLCPGHPSVYQQSLHTPPPGAAAASAAQQRLVSLPAGHFDAAVMSLVLSYMPLPTQRAAMVSKARALLSTPAACEEPGREWLRRGAGRLLIIEPYSTATGGRRLCNLPALQQWCAAIESMGFKFEEYKFLGRSHALAFSAVPLQDPSATASSSTASGDAELSGAAQAEVEDQGQRAPALEIAFDDAAVFAKYQGVDRPGG
ncbi:hypothetical protein JKP88DRAFT_319744, partial [Tribonema minus]